MRVIREPAVSGIFYPDDPLPLKTLVNQYLTPDKIPESAVSSSVTSSAPKALIVPHAGFIYSGAIAGQAYQSLLSAANNIHRVVLLGPSHHVAFQGIAFCGADAFCSPLGTTPIDQQAFCAISDLPKVTLLDEAHRNEHSLEVQLPFLQCLLDDFKLVPLVVGDVSTGVVSNVLDTLWGGEETLIVISSDLSHFLDYNAAQALDQQTRLAIEHLDPENIGYDQACGRNPVKGLLEIARRKKLSVSTLAMCNSGDASGDRSRVVGYGAWAFYEA